MESDTGNDRLENTGIVVGNLILGSGTNSIFNAEGATFVTIDTLDLQDGAGSSGLFTNEGNFLLGRSAPRSPSTWPRATRFGGRAVGGDRPRSSISIWAPT